MTRKKTEYFEVTLLLKPEQYVETNKWKVRINGEERIVTQKAVAFFVESFDAALASFDKSQVIGLRIKPAEIGFETSIEPK